MKKIIHIINGLGSGGAENMLYKLLKYSDRTKYYHEVISLLDEGVFGEKIREESIKVHTLNIKRKNIIKSFGEMRIICKEFDIIDTWLYHADIIGFIIAKILLKKKLIWNVRHSNLEKRANKLTTLTIIKINAYLSKFVDCITYNSEKALLNHNRVGYSSKKSVVIPNGFEFDLFKFDNKKRLKVRKELKLQEKQKVIITVGRWDVQKGYPTLLKALKLVAFQFKDFKFIMCGNKLNHLNKELVELIDKYDLSQYILLLGRRDNVAELLSAADLYVSSSLGESFSNAIGEAMACELPCIVTDVGDSKKIIGDTGVVVQPEDYVSLANSMLTYLNDEALLHRCQRARERVTENYDIKFIIGFFDDLYATL